MELFVEHPRIAVLVLLSTSTTSRTLRGLNGSVFAPAPFLLSRTVGLPGYHPHDWPPEQIAALVFEAVYLVAFVIALGKRRSRPRA